MPVSCLLRKSLRFISAHYQNITILYRLSPSTLDQHTLLSNHNSSAYTLVKINDTTPRPTYEIMYEQPDIGNIMCKKLLDLGMEICYWMHWALMASRYPKKRCGLLQIIDTIMAVMRDESYICVYSTFDCCSYQILLILVSCCESLADCLHLAE